MPKLLEKHSKPVAEHVFAAALWDILRWGVPTLVTWITAHIASLSGWPLPLIILLGAAVFALVSAGIRRLIPSTRKPHQELSTTEEEIDFSPSPSEKLRNEKDAVDEALIRSRSEAASLDEQLKAVQGQLQAHEQLIGTAIDDKAAIKDLVIVCIVRTRIETEGGDPHIALTFYILNMSLRPVSVESVEGSIRFTETDNYLRDRTLLREPITLSDKDNSAKDIPFRETGSFTIYQPLTERNINSMAPAGALLWLSDLEITIKAEGCDPVRIPSGPAFIGKNRDWPSERAESYFIYRDTVRAEAKLRTVEAERDALKQLVGQQPQKALTEGSEKK
jgi:hypothetical protein